MLLIAIANKQGELALGFFAMHAQIDSRCKSNAGDDLVRAQNLCLLVGYALDHCRYHRGGQLIAFRLMQKNFTVEYYYDVLEERAFHLWMRPCYWPHHLVVRKISFLPILKRLSRKNYVSSPKTYLRSKPGYMTDLAEKYPDRM